MSCFEIHFDLPTVPDFFLGDVALSIPFPIDPCGLLNQANPDIPAAGCLCCQFLIDIPQISKAIAVINAAIKALILSLSAAAMGIIIAANAVIAIAQAEINEILGQLTIECPLGSGTTNLST